MRFHRLHRLIGLETPFRAVNWLPRPSACKLKCRLRVEFSGLNVGIVAPQITAIIGALKWINRPGIGANWLVTSTSRLGRLGGDDNVQDRTVMFSHVYPGTEFHISNGRTVRMAEDGIYRVTPEEWQGMMHEAGVTRVEAPGS